MACQISYNKSGEVVSVRAPNMRPSHLYNNIRTAYEDLSKKEALEVWVESYTPEFIEAYVGSRDENGEAVFNDARGFLIPVVDELRFSADQTELLRAIAADNKMSSSGFFPAHTTAPALEAEMNRRNIKGIKIQTLPNGTHFYTDEGNFYNPFEKAYYKDFSDPQLRDWRLSNVITNLVRTLGVQVEWTDDLGPNVVGQADALNRIIRLTEGKADMTTLTRELTHIMVSMMRGSDRYNAMIAEIMKMPTYEQTKLEYSNYYSEERIAEEALVNHLSDVTEQESQSKHWWDLILDYLRGVFGLQPKAVRLFREAARDILNQDLDSLGIQKDAPLAFEFDDEIWLEIEHIPENQKDVLDVVNEWNKGLGDKDGSRYVYKGKTLRYRASDKVMKLRIRLYGQGEFQADKKDLFTTKGTILHLYQQMIMHDVINAPKGPLDIDHPAIRQQVYEMLKNEPEFEGRDQKYFNISQTQFITLVKGVATLRNSIMHEDANAIIITEQFVPDVEGNIGGTIDVFVIHGDGTLSLYDYKNTQFKRKSKFGYLAPDTEDKKLQLWDHQVAVYKEMLMKGLNKTHRDFRQTRIIPVNVQYNGEKIIVIQMASKGATKRHLRQIIASHEKLWGDDNLNELLEKMYNERTSLRSALATANAKERKFLEVRIGQINNDVSDLLVRGDVENMLKGLTGFVQTIKQNIKDLSAGGLNNVTSRLDMYMHFPIAFQKTLEAVEDQEKQEELQNSMADFGSFLQEAYGMVLDEKLARSQEHYDNTGENLITEGGRAPGMLSEIFEGINKMSEPVADTIFKLLRQKAEDQRLLLLKYEGDINKKSKAYAAWAKKMGYGSAGTGIYAPLIRKTETTLSLITPFSKAFYDKQTEIREEYVNNVRNGRSTKVQVEWMMEHKVFDEERWQANKDKEEERLRAMGTVTDEQLEDRLASYDYYNPLIQERAWFQQNNYNIRIREWSDEAMKPFVNSEYEFIQGHEAAREYLEMLVKYNSIMGKLVGYDYVRPNSIANIRASLVEKLSNWGAFGVHVSMGKTDLLGAIEMREIGELDGAQDGNGMPLNRIPILYTDDILEPVGPRQQAKIRKDVAGEGLEIGSPDFEEEVERRIQARKRKLGLDQKSQDLTASLKIMLDNAMRYHYMSEIEDEVLMIRSVLDMDKYKQIPTDNWGRRMMNMFTRQAQQRQGSGASMIELVDIFLNAHMYGRKTQSKDQTIAFGGKEYSRNRLVDRAHQLLSLSTIAFNPIIGGANWVNAAVNKSIQGKRGRYYTTATAKEALETLAKVDDKALAAMWYLEPKQGNIQREKATRTRAGFLNKIMTSRYAYMFHRGDGPNQFGARKTKQQLSDNGYLSVDNPYWGDDSVGNLIMIAMMKTWVIDKGDRNKLKNPNDPFHEIKDPESKTIWENFDHDGLIDNFDPDVVPIEGMTKETLADFRAMIARAQSEVKGSTSAWDYSKADSQVAFQLITKFRSWIPAMAAARFEGLRKDTLFDTFTEGYIKGTWSELVGKGTAELIQEDILTETTIFGYYINHFVRPTLRNFLKLFGEALPFGLYDYKINKERAIYGYNKMLLENPEIDKKRFTFDAFLVFRKNQIKAAALEVRYLVGTVMMYHLIRYATDWDEEENTNIATRYIYQLSKRAKLELSFWFDPQSVTDIIKSPIPVWRLVNDLDAALGNFWGEGFEAIGLLDENTRDRTPMFYYTMKRLPALNQVLSLTGYFPGYDDQQSTLARYFQETAFKR